MNNAEARPNVYMENRTNVQTAVYPMHRMENMNRFGYDSFKHWTFSPISNVQRRMQKCACATQSRSSASHVVEIDCFV